MALTLRSLASAARRRMRLAQEHVHDAQEHLEVANKDLAESIPSGDIARIRYAHIRTQRAEKAVAQASDELDVAGELLAEEPQAQVRTESSGQGVRTIVETLRSGPKQ